MITIIGLGNPGKEYEGTRHNAGREAAFYFAKKHDLEPFALNKKANAIIIKSKIGKEQIFLALPETFMNKSGSAAAKLVRPKKEMKNLIVIHDDLDILIGKFKVSYGKNSGGHKGVESVMRAMKTKNFVRIRIGICPPARGVSAVGRKPDQKKLINFIVNKFSSTEQTIIKKVWKRVAQALETIITDSLERAMSEYN